MKNFSSHMSCALLMCSMVFLPSCDWKSKLGLSNGTSSSVAANDNTQVIATIDGKPLMTAGEFEKQFKNFIEKHPYGAMFAQMEGVDRKIFDGLLGQKVMTRWVEEQGIDKTPEYKEYLDQLVQMLNARFFQMKHPVTVTDAEIKAFYDQNKENMPEAVLSRGGVNASGVQFAKEADAKAFLEKAKGKGSLDKVAKEANLNDKFRDFKLVNAASLAVDAGLRDKIVAVKKFPTLEVFKASDNSFWVILVTGKEDQKYRGYEELKAAIEQRLSAQKQEQAMEKAMEQLKKDYKVEVVEEYFTKKNAGAPKEIENDEQLEMVMPETPQTAQAKAPASNQKAA